MRLLVTLHLTLCVALMTSCQTPDTLSPVGSTTEVEQETRKQKGQALKRILAEEKRILDVAFPILRSNAPYCPKTSYESGIVYWNASNVSKTFGEEYEGIANIHFGLGEVVVVRDVIEGSPAHEAGIKKGDKVVAVKGAELPLGLKGMGTLRYAYEDTKEPGIELTFSRSGEEYTKTITRVEACDYGIAFISSSSNPFVSPDEVNAFADGKNIIITRGMLRFVDDDEQLALVVAHELAHNAMGHAQKKTANALTASMPAAILEGIAASYGVPLHGTLTNASMIAGAHAFSVEFEREADYVGMYYLARAGYDTSNVADFWRRMGNENNSSAITKSVTHPTSPERFIAIEKTHEEIVAKLERGEKLVPNLKGQEKEAKKEN